MHATCRLIRHYAIKAFKQRADVQYTKADEDLLRTVVKRPDCPPFAVPIDRWHIAMASEVAMADTYAACLSITNIYPS